MGLFHKTMADILTTYGEEIESSDPTKAKNAGIKAYRKFRLHEGKMKDLRDDLAGMRDETEKFFQMEQQIRAYIATKAGIQSSSRVGNKSIKDGIPEFRRIARNLRMFANKISSDERLAE